MAEFPSVKQNTGGDRRTEGNISSHNAPIFNAIPPKKNLSIKEAVLPVHITFEEILERLGCFGRFQLLTMCSYLFLEFSCAFVAFIPIFVTRSSLPQNCHSEESNFSTTTTSTESTMVYYDDAVTTVENEMSTISSLDNFTPISSVVAAKSLTDNFQEMFDSLFKYESLVDEWDLRCNKAWVPALFTTVMMGGMAVGGLFASQLADWYGRRRPYLLILALKMLGMLICTFSPSPYVYAVGRFIAGAGFSGVFIISTMAVMEFMTPKWRSVANCVGPIGEGIVLLSVLGYYFRPWRMLYLTALVPYLAIIPIYMYLPESPRWLLSNGRTKEAYEVLGYMARVNKREPISMELLIAFKKQEELATESQKSNRMSYLKFIRTRSLFILALYLFTVWFSWNMSYYGLMYNLKNVDGNPYLNLGMVGIANAIGQRVSFIVCDRLGRRRAVLASMSFSASFLVSMAICFLTLPHVDTKIILVGCFFGLLGLSSSRACIRLLSGESFPTAVRMMGLCLSGLGANFSGLITPQLVYLGSKSPPVPFFIFACVSVVGSFMVFMMKETTGNPLSDNVRQQINQQNNEKKSGNV